MLPIIFLVVFNKNESQNINFIYKKVYNKVFVPAVSMNENNVNFLTKNHTKYFIQEFFPLKQFLQKHVHYTYL